jgi:hypothetical protein
MAGKRAGLFDLSTGAGANYRQAERDAEVIALLKAVLTAQQQQVNLLNDIARMMWEQRQPTP